MGVPSSLPLDDGCHSSEMMAVPWSAAASELTRDTHNISMDIVSYGLQFSWRISK